MPNEYSNTAYIEFSSFLPLREPNGKGEQAKFNHYQSLDSRLGQAVGPQRKDLEAKEHYLPSSHPPKKADTLSTSVRTVAVVF